MNWHHHHEDGGEPSEILGGEITFHPGEDCIDEYHGLICKPGEDRIWDDNAQRWITCQFHLVWGEYVVDVGEQLALMTHLEVAGGEQP